MFIYPKFDLQFFAQADTGNQGGAEDNTQAGDNPQGESHKADGQQGNDGSQKQDDKFIPKSRFDEVNEKYKTLQQQLDDLNKAKEQEELEAKKKKGEFENLYTEAQSELETTKSEFEKTSERVGQLEGIIQTLVDAELEAVPEEMRDLVPENFTAEQKLSWITNAKKKGLFGAATNSKENEELGGGTNNQRKTENVEVGKMSVTQLLKQAYGK